jgi:putative addiction module component (TIGR02574 family)
LARVGEIPQYTTDPFFFVLPALIESVDNGGLRDNVDAAWASEVRRRLAEVQSGVVKPVPWEDAEKRIFDTE